MANSSMAKSMAMQMAQGAYKGLKGVGKSIRKVVRGIEGRSKAGQDAKRARNTKMIEKNFGSTDNYLNNYK